MKHVMSDPTSLARRIHRLAAAALLCGATLAPTFAFEEVSRDKAAIVMGPGVAIGDETIGTLPVFLGGSIELVRGLPIVRPSFFLEGDLLELQNSIAFFQGTARAAVVPLDPEWHRVRLVFVDEVMLGFDRVALLGADLEMGVWMPPPAWYAYPQLSWGGRTFEALPIDSRLSLPLCEMSASGALDMSPLLVEASSASGSNAMMAAVNQDFLFVAQRH